MKPIRDPELYVGLCEIEDLLEKKGWIKGESRNSDGHCLLDAISRATGSIYNQTRDAICSAIVTEGPRRGWSIGASVVAFNDDPETTFDDVRRVLRKAREDSLTPK